MGTNIVAFFTSSGVPATGLSPLLTSWELDGTVALNAVAMTESGGGFYYYGFGSPYTPAEDFLFRADGGATLSNADRYVYSSNEVDQVSLGSGGGRGDIIIPGKKSPWTHKQRDELIKNMKETRNLMKEISENIDKYHKDDTTKYNDIKKAINDLISKLGIMKNNLSSKSDVGEIIDKIDETMKILDKHKISLDKSTFEDIRMMSEDIKSLASIVYSMLPDENIEDL